MHHAAQEAPQGASGEEGAQRFRPEPGRKLSRGRAVATSRLTVRLTADFGDRIDRVIGARSLGSARMSKGRAIEELLRRGLLDVERELGVEAGGAPTEAA